MGGGPGPEPVPDDDRTRTAPGRQTTTPGGDLSPGLPNHALTRLAAPHRAELAAALRSATELDAHTSGVMASLVQLIEPANQATAATQSALEEHEKTYRAAYTPFRDTIAKAEAAAKAPSAMSVIFGVATGILVAVGVAEVAALISAAASALSGAAVAAQTATRRIVVTSVEAVAGQGVTAIGAQISPASPPPSFAVPADLDPELAAAQSWQEIALAWRRLAELSATALAYGEVARSVSVVHERLQAWASGASGPQYRDELITAVADLRAQVAGVLDPAAVEQLRQEVVLFGGQSANPVLHRDALMMEQDLWIDWIGRLNATPGAPRADPRDDMWPEFVTDTVTAILSSDVILDRLKDLGMIGGWYGYESGMHRFPDSAQGPAALFRAAVAARRAGADAGLLGVIRGAGSTYDLEILPPGGEAWVAAQANVPDVPWAPGPRPPAGRRITVMIDPGDATIGQLCVVVGGSYYGGIYAEPLPADSAMVPTWVPAWLLAMSTIGPEPAPPEGEATQISQEALLVIQGTPADQAMVSVWTDRIMVTGPIDQVPEQVVVSVDGLLPGHVVTTADLTLPPGVVAPTDPPTPVIEIGPENSRPGPLAPLGTSEE